LSALHLIAYKIDL